MASSGAFDGLRRDHAVVDLQEALGGQRQDRVVLSVSQEAREAPRQLVSHCLIRRPGIPLQRRFESLRIVHLVAIARNNIVLYAAYGVAVIGFADGGLKGCTVIEKADWSLTSSLCERGSPRCNASWPLLQNGY